MITKDEIKIGSRVIQNESEEPRGNPFKGTIIEILPISETQAYNFLVKIKLDEEFAEMPLFRAISHDGVLPCFPWQIDVIAPEDEMNQEQLLAGITEHLRKNNGEWDLVSDLGNTMIYDHQKGMPIRDLTINKDDEPAVIVSLSYFSEETIREILKEM